ncbi:MAG: SDR family NAD(P)-dependent oxidoreductase [Candidatus Promineifilaceae bacterium]|nr:SDR family NAD(P)-dependent oxidoreductase [Candidatus Promineifilaceae bacterium]
MTTKTALIWGAGGGIGQALVKALKGHGWQTVGLYHRPEPVEHEADFRFEADVGQEHAVRDAVLSITYEVEKADLFVYTVGDILATPVKELDAEGWRRILDANLTGAYLTTHHSLPLLEENAHLFYLGAVSERLRLPGLSAYAAAKAGLEAFADTVRKEQRQRKVTLVRPVAVDTPLWEKVPMRLPKGAAQATKVAGRILDAYEEGQTGVLNFD